MNFNAIPPNAAYHGFGQSRRAASLERICIPTFTECSAGKSQLSVCQHRVNFNMVAIVLEISLLSLRRSFSSNE